VPGPNQNNQQAVPIPINQLLLNINPNKYGTQTSDDNTKKVIPNITAVRQSLML